MEDEKELCVICREYEADKFDYCSDCYEEEKADRNKD